ncbi:MAG: LysR family transcriptional regulator [Proteobacteria bacterium]|nr:LysR family transcriptional regulator [Pseudomonadota bacterium]MBU1595238.1 LysR family transcriptional regulator [Pseudomonadota bacterium]
MNEQGAPKQAESGRTVIRLHLWLERGGNTAFGMGRLQLLERIETCGSLKAAAIELGMSYRAAWGKLKASEEALGVALVEKVGGNKSGCRLTQEGIALAGAYRAWFAEVERHAVSRAGALFPFMCDRFQERKRPPQHSNPACCASTSISATQNI